MNGQPAKVLRPTDVRRAISLVARGRQGTRNKAMILLSVKAGLRAGEIAKLTWARRNTRSSITLQHGAAV